MAKLGTPNASSWQSHFWNLAAPDVCQRLSCSEQGLSAEEALARLTTYGANADVKQRRVTIWSAIGRRLFEPLSLLLLAAAVVSALTGDAVGGLIIAAILTFSLGLDTFQEGHATKAVDVLRKSVALQAEVKRDGIFIKVPVERVVPGDVIRVRGGDIIPADALVLEARSLAALEAALTGEPYAVEKRALPSSSSEPAEARNALFRGATVQTGEGIALAVSTGRETLFGAASAALAAPDVISPFQRDLHAFGLMAARMTLGLVLIVLTAHVLAGRSTLQSLMFAVALAVGLTPELLPMITTVTLARGALRMAKRKVIVKRLASIHDLGAMTILATDKTGTLTSAEIRLAGSYDFAGKEDANAGQLGAIAAKFGGNRGAMDEALIAFAPDAATKWIMRKQLPFDFVRRYGGVDLADDTSALCILKGAPEAILGLASLRRLDGTAVALSDADCQSVKARLAALAEQGFRTIAIASKAHKAAPEDQDIFTPGDFTFEGICAFADPLKPTAAAAVARLACAGIRLKILSGDDPVAVKRIATQVGLRSDVLSGSEITALSDEALAVQVQDVDAFARLTPDQKSRVIRALQTGQTVVGYLGDGINDAPALKIADIGLSVDDATAVAQAAADIILLDSDLEVVCGGVEEGRRTFLNILKYLRMAASSNFGNMLSMAVASLFLPFLPMLPTQILLNNLLYDISEVGIPFDSVRPEAMSRPQVWNLKRLVRFAAIMGPLSSLFDLLMFGGLIYLFHSSPVEFRSAWFIESMATQILVIFIIRTNARPWKDLPRLALCLSSIAALALALILPFIGAGVWFQFTPIPLSIACYIAGLVASYLLAAEFLKRYATV